MENPVSILHVGKLITPHREYLCVVHSLSSREALVRTSLRLAPGESVTLGLRNGFSMAAIVGMVQGEQVALMFEGHVSTSVILAEQRNGRDEREAVRLNIVMPVSLITPYGSHGCTMQNISLFGIKLLDEASLLTEGMEVQVLVEGLGKRDATVRWCRAPYAGLNFHVALGFKVLDQWAMQVNG